MPPSSKRSPSIAPRAASAALVCAAACLPALARAQCAPAPKRRDPLAQAVAALHAPAPSRPATRPRPNHVVAHPMVRPVALAVVRPIARRASVAHTPAPAAPARKHVAARPRPKATVRQIACPADTTAGLPLPARFVDAEYGAVPLSPFVVGMVASEAPRPMALATLPSRLTRDSGGRSMLPWLVLPGVAVGTRTGISVVAAAAGSTAWHVFGRRPHAPLAPPAGGAPTQPGAFEPPSDPSSAPPFGPAAGGNDPAAGDEPPPDVPTATGDTATAGGPPGDGPPPLEPMTGSDPGDDPPPPGGPLFPEPVPGLPMPEWPTGDPDGPHGGPPATFGPTGEPGAPSTVPEPATGALLLGGAAALGAVVRRRRT